MAEMTTEEYFAEVAARKANGGPSYLPTGREVDFLASRRALMEAGLSARTANNLARSGFASWRELKHFTPAELLRLPSFGRKCLNEVEHLLGCHGIHLRGADTASLVSAARSRVEKAEKALVQARMELEGLLAA